MHFKNPNLKTKLIIEKNLFGSSTLVFKVYITKEQCPRKKVACHQVRGHCSFGMVTVTVSTVSVLGYSVFSKEYRFRDGVVRNV